MNNIQTTSLQINNINDSDTELSKKITEILIIYEKNPNFKGKSSFKKWCNYCRRYGHSSADCRRKQQDNQNKPQNYRKPNKSFHQNKKKDQTLPNKNLHSNNSSGKPLPNTLDDNHPIIRVIEEDHHTEEIREISHKTVLVDHIVEIVNIEITTQDQIQTDLSFRLMPVPIQILEIEIIQLIFLETLHTIDIETIQIIETLDIKIINHAVILTTDQNITIIKKDHAIIHRIKIRIITIDKETTLSHHIGITHVIKTHNKIKGVVHLKIKGK